MQIMAMDKQVRDTTPITMSTRAMADMVAMGMASPGRGMARMGQTSPATLASSAKPDVGPII